MRYHADVSTGHWASWELAELCNLSCWAAAKSSTELPCPACLGSTSNTHELWCLPKFAVENQHDSDSEAWDSTVCSGLGLGVPALLPSSPQVITFPALSSLSLSNPQSDRTWLSSPSPNLQKFQHSWKTAQVLSKRTDQVHRESFSTEQTAWQCKNEWSRILKMGRARLSWRAGRA